MKLRPAVLDWSAHVRISLSDTHPHSGRRIDPDTVRAFRQAVRDDLIHAAPPFRLEALHSAQSTKEYLAFRDELDALAQAPADANSWLIAERSQRELAEDPAVSHRIAMPDLLLATIASQHGLAVLHYDADYDLLAEHTSLEFESVWIAPPGSVD